MRVLLSLLVVLSLFAMLGVAPASALTALDRLKDRAAAASLAAAEIAQVLTSTSNQLTHKLITAQHSS
jgi:hypothetical protein